MVQTTGFQVLTVATAQEQQFTTDPETSFNQAWAGGSRLNIHLSADDLARVRALYIEQFKRLLETEEDWNHDYEQFVVAVKGSE